MVWRYDRTNKRYVMKRIFFLLMVSAPVWVLTSCKPKADEFAFDGKAIYRVECTLMSQSISEQDWGYVLELSAPDSLGGDYYDVHGEVHHNCIVLYRTRYQFTENDRVSGMMYLDEDYSRSLCAYHHHLGLPEGVCTKLD